MLSFVLLLGLHLPWVHGIPQKNPSEPPQAPASGLTVFLGEMRGDADLLVRISQLGGKTPPTVFLLDTPAAHAGNTRFLKELRPAQIQYCPQRTVEMELEKRLGFPIKAGEVRLEDLLEPTQKKIVLCPPQPRDLLLQATCLAGYLKAPLLVLSEKEDQLSAIREKFQGSAIQEIYALGPNAELAGKLDKVKVRPLPTGEDVFEMCRQLRAKKASIRTLVVANPHDHTEGKGGMAVLAPYIALQKKALLVLTNERGTDVAKKVRDLCKQPGLEKVDSIILVGNLADLPMVRRPNPLPEGKDPYIEMEPLTPAGEEPFSFAVGRIFHPDRGMVALQLARSQLLAQKPAAPPKALVVSNPGGSLPFLETFSRQTANELRGAGYDVTGLFNRGVDEEQVRRLLPEQSIFLWEGHHSTLIRDYAVHEWTEPLRPSLIFLQSCLALTEPKALPFLERGAVGVIGSSSRTYSGSGGALSLAYFDALVYERQTVGGALRHAKNFLASFGRLKEQRLADQAKLNGVSQRTAWAFTLWGDPTLKLSAPEAHSLPTPARHQLKGNTLIVNLPQAPSEKVTSAKYQAQVRPSVRLAGLLRKVEDPEKQELVPLVFLEIPLTGGESGQVPRLSGRLPARNWVFSWDERRQRGYLLLIPRERDGEEIRFQVKWDTELREKNESW